MPCYNCTATLEEAVASISAQNLSTPYEVIMIDDSSTDNTRALILELAKKYPNISYHFHEKNRGGGAARNTGISKSTGNLIYCLDSDNVFAHDSVQKLINYLDDKKLNGVAFHDRRFFVGNNLKNYRSQINNVLDRPIALSDLFASQGILLDNFMFTKASFLQTEGYPEHHGFDTQTFELRYLSAGFSVMIVPDTTFYHRQGAKEKSYFERAFESGEFSRNMYLAYEDIFYLFSDGTRKTIISHDLFKKNNLNDESLSSAMTKAFEKDPDNFFIKDYKRFLVPQGFEKCMSQHAFDASETGIFCSAIYKFKKHQFEQSLAEYIQLLKVGLKLNIISYNILRCVEGIAGIEPPLIEKNVTKLIDNLQSQKQKISLKPNIIKKIANKIKRNLWTK